MRIRKVSSKSVSRKPRRKSRKSMNVKKSKKNNKTKSSKKTKKTKRHVKRKSYIKKGGSDTDSDSSFSHHIDDFNESVSTMYPILYPGHDAARRGLKDVVSDYVRLTPEPRDIKHRVNSKDNMGKSMLFIAIEHQKPEIVYYLLNCLKADYHEKLINGHSILEWTFVDPEMFTDAINDMIMDRALKDDIIDNEEYNDKVRTGPQLGEFFGEPEPDEYLDDSKCYIS